MDFAQARIASLNYAFRTIGNDPGAPPLAVAPWGWEDDTHYQTLVDTRAAIVDGNDLAGLADAAMYLVDKATGQVTQPPWTECLELRESMTPVGLRGPGLKLVPRNS